MAHLYLWHICTFGTLVPMAHVYLVHMCTFGTFSLFPQVEVLVGKDKGKRGVINKIVLERNWCFVEGLHCVSTSYKYSLDIARKCF